MASTSSRTAAADWSKAARSSACSSISTDLADAAAAELDRHADEQAVDAVLALEVAPRRAGSRCGR